MKNHLRLSALRASFQDIENIKQDGKVHFSLGKPLYKPKDRIPNWDRIFTPPDDYARLTGLAVCAAITLRYLPQYSQPLYQTKSTSWRKEARSSSTGIVPTFVRIGVARLHHQLLAAATTLSSAVLSNGNPVDISTWQKCTLISISELPGGVFKYRFGLKHSRDYLPLEIGQEVSTYETSSSIANSLLCVHFIYNS